jgi:2-polyprenyl-3-methyl-5-hydroxy-6-metoxy-1,4-benzoquinol methylase
MKEQKWYSEFGEYTIEEYVKERFLMNADEMERLYRVISLVPEDTLKLLDVGCGVGLFWICFIRSAK